MPTCLITLFNVNVSSLNDQASDDQVKLGIDSTNPQNCSEWRGHLRKTGQIELTLWRGLQ